MLSLDAGAGKYVATGLWCRGMAQAIGIDAVMRYKFVVKGNTVDSVRSNFSIGSQMDDPSDGPSGMCLRNTTALYNNWLPPLLDVFREAKLKAEGMDSYITESTISSGDFDEAEQSFRDLVDDGSGMEVVTVDNASDEEEEEEE